MIKIITLNFFDEVIKTVKKIPQGKVATYGQVASLVSAPRAARQVGWVLSRIKSPTDIPWQRVINSKGMVSIESMAVSKREQAKRLQAEGVEVVFRDGNWFIDLDKYQWRHSELT